MKLSDEIKTLQQSKALIDPRTHRVDSIAWVQLEMLYHQARLLERRLQCLTDRSIPEITLGPDAWVTFGD